MASATSERVPAVDAWEVAAFRFTAFLTPSGPPVSDTWWGEVVGEDPETTTERPKAGERKQEGPYGNGQLTLSVTLGRVDWVLGPKLPTEPPEGFLVAGAFVQSCTRFTDLVDKWLTLDTCPSLQRIAIGAVLLQPVADRASGYRKLESYLPSVRLDCENSRGFLYQINRPRAGPIRDIKINRISKWSVQSSNVTGMAVENGQLRVLATAEQVYACRLELDVNTDANFTEEFTLDEAKQIHSALVEMATEIAREGDQP